MPKTQRGAKNRAPGEEHNYLDFAGTRLAKPNQAGRNDDTPRAASPAVEQASASASGDKPYDH